MLDLSTEKGTKTIKTGSGSHGIVSSPDNKYVYVTNMFEDTVSVIDVEQERVLKTIKVPSVPNGISITG
jgi:YVTN family beta-propeller protein